MTSGSEDVRAVSSLWIVSLLSDDGARRRASQLPGVVGDGEATVVLAYGRE